MRTACLGRRQHGRRRDLKAGVTFSFQNPANRRGDHDVYTDELAMASRVEELGFDSIWTLEHHFTDYVVSPSPLQFLTYMAARTERISLGTAVVVLPWHDPLRVAEQVSVLDHMSNGRVLLGLGRGLGRVEFEGFRVPMGESRARFSESAEAVISALETGTMEYDGEFVRQPPVPLRPAPFRSFRGRTFISSTSPESLETVVRLGAGLLFIVQKPWEGVLEDLEHYRARYREVQHSEAPPPTAQVTCVCSTNASEAEDLANRYIGGYYRTVLEHYEVASGHFSQTPGYEFYAGMKRMLDKHGADGMSRFFRDLQVWGTPEECFRKASEIRERIGCDHMVFGFSIGGMPYEQANQSMDLFAERVLPELQKLDA